MNEKRKVNRNRKIRSSGRLLKTKIENIERRKCKKKRNEKTEKRRKKMRKQK